MDSTVYGLLTKIKKETIRINLKQKPVSPYTVYHEITRAKSLEQSAVRMIPVALIGYNSKTFACKYNEN